MKLTPRMMHSEVLQKYYAILRAVGIPATF